MIRRPPRSTRTATLFPDTALYRSTPDKVWLVPRGSVLWLPAGTPHRSLAPEERLMRSLYVRPDSADVLPAAPTAVEQGTPLADRSEEHTSELQSLMRLSYAVFCLKKKS